MTEIDVLIVGAGPTGLTMALELSLQNVSFRIVDASPEPSDKSRAMVLHARTLELLRRHGIVDEFITKGRFNEGIRMFSNGKFVFEIDLLDLGFEDAEWMTPLMISQAETEALLDASFSTPVERGVAIKKLEQDDERATASLKHSNGTTEIVKAKYVVGCDGFRSFVRTSLQIPFTGSAYAQDFLLADIHMKWSQKDNLTTFIGTYGFLITLALPNNVYRLMCTRPPGAANEPTIKYFEDSIRHLVPGEVKLWDPVWLSRFVLHHRIAENYRKGRVFLAGDAAHVHSPAGAQGMNAGMHDSVNLGWKLALVLRGLKPDSFLNSYNTERRHIGLHLLRKTDRLFEALGTRNRLLLWLRNLLVPWVVPWMMGNKERRRSRMRFVSQLGVRYRQSDIVSSSASYSGPYRGGDRMPDGIIRVVDGETRLQNVCVGAGYHLLLFCCEYDKGNADLRWEKEGVSVHQIVEADEVRAGAFVDVDGKLHDLLGFKERGYVLVRPDGYIEYIGMMSELEELKEWLQ